MRTPTSPEAAYRWYRDALAGKKPPIHHGHPQCGYFMRRIVAKGPWVPASIYMDQRIGPEGDLLEPEVMRCEVGGRMRKAEDEWTWLAGRPITEEQYMEMVAGVFAPAIDESAGAESHSRPSPEGEGAAKVASLPAPADPTKPPY